NKEEFCFGLRRRARLALAPLAGGPRLGPPVPQCPSPAPPPPHTPPPPPPSASSPPRRRPSGRPRARPPRWRWGRSSWTGPPPLLRPVPPRRLERRLRRARPTGRHPAWSPPRPRKISRELDVSYGTVVLWSRGRGQGPLAG